MADLCVFGFGNVLLKTCIGHIFLTFWIFIFMFIVFFAPKGLAYFSSSILTIFEFTNVFSSVRINDFSLAIALVIFKFTDIPVTIGDGQSTLPVTFIIFKLTNVLTPVCIGHNTLPTAVVHFPLTDILFTVGVN